MKIHNASKKQQAQIKFRKGFKPTWSESIYKISQVKYNGVWYFKVVPENANEIFMQILENPTLNIPARTITRLEAFPEIELFYYENELIKVL